MKLKAGDYIELEGVSEEGLKQVRDAFVAAGFENKHGLGGRYTWEAFGAVTDYECCFLHSRCTEAKRLLTIDQVLSTNIEFEEAHQQVAQATEDAVAEDEEFARIEKQARYTKEDGKDLIDQWAERYTPEEFRLIMLSMIEKYMTRMGRKDSIASECRKIADFASRLALVEEGRG